MDNQNIAIAASGRSGRTQSSNAPVLGGTLAPYTGPWTVREAGHLMRRATFGPDQSTVDEVINLGLDATIDRLFSAAHELPDPPVKWILDAPVDNRLYRRLIPFVEDPEVSYGDTWVNARLVPSTGDPQQDARINVYRLQSMYGWIFYLMNQGKVSIREKMAIFWHNHFVVANFRLPKMIYQYMSHFFEHSVGDFKQLTKDITIDPSMLLYLNGAENTAAAPNENYARELLELFTIGKGELAGPGDYTNYTEDDVRAISKALTGWTKHRGF